MLGSCIRCTSQRVWQRFRRYSCNNPHNTSQRVWQRFRRYSFNNPHNITVTAPTTILALPTVKDNIRREIENVPPTRTVSAWVDYKKGEIMISGDSSEDVKHLKSLLESMLERCLSRYTTTTLELDTYQGKIAERWNLTDKLNAFGSSRFYKATDGTLCLEITTPNEKSKDRRLMRLLSLLQHYSKVDLENELFVPFLKAKGRAYLGDGKKMTGIITEDAVVFTGSNDKAREAAARKLRTFLGGLTVLQVPFPHPVYKSMLLGKEGRKIRPLSNKYPDVYTLFSDDDNKMHIISWNVAAAEQFVEAVQDRVESFNHVSFSKLRNSQLLYPIVKDQDRNMFKVTLKKLVSKVEKVDEWLIYGEAQEVYKFVEVLKENKRAAYRGKVVKQVRVKDYHTWHPIVLYAREVNRRNATVKCMYDDDLRSPPGLISIVGLKSETDLVFQKMQDIIKTVRDEVGSKSKQSLEKEANSVLVTLPSVQLRIAGTMRFSFPNVNIRTNSEKTGLVIWSEYRSSRILAEEYTRAYFSNSHETTFQINDKHWQYLSNNRAHIQIAINRCCGKHGVRYKLSLEDRSLTLLGPPRNTRLAKQNIDTYFYKKHQRDPLDLFSRPPGSARLYVETVKIEAAKVQALFDVRVGNFGNVHHDVDTMVLPGKMGTEQSNLRLTSSSERALRNAVAGVSAIQSEIELQYIGLRELEYERARAIDTASPDYKFLFPKDERKCWIKLDKRSPQFCVASKSSVEVESAIKKLKHHLHSIEHFEQIDLVTKKMGVWMDVVMQYIRKEVDSKKTRVLVSERDNKILVFGKSGDVEKTTAALFDIIKLENWTVVRIVLEGCKDVSKAVDIRVAIMKSFPYLMVEYVPENPSGAAIEDIVLTMSLPTKVLQDYPTTFQSVEQLLQSY